MIAMNTKAVQERIDDLLAQAQSLVALAEKENRQLSDEEKKKFDEIHSEIGTPDKDKPTGLYASLSRAKWLQEETERRRNAVQTTDGGRAIEIQGATAGDVKLKEPPAGQWGFKDMGEFAINVVRSSLPRAAVDPRLIKNAPTTGVTEGVGEQGGFTIPPDFVQEILRKVDPEESLAARCLNRQTSKNAVTYWMNETTPWGTAGVQVYWDGERDQLTQSGIKLKEATVKLNKLTALVPATSEALEDGPLLGSFLMQEAPIAMDQKLSLAILAGTGAGQPLGIRTAASTISVAKEGSQVADTIVGLNIMKMFMRMPQKNRRRAVWVINQDAEVQLAALTKQGKLDTGAADTGWGVPVNGLAYNAAGELTLMDRPVIYHQACETLGDKGDIHLCDFSQYLLLTKAGGIRAESSIHLWFDYDTTAFRFIFRVGGQPLWTESIAARDGSQTYSAFVTLDERA